MRARAACSSSAAASLRSSPRSVSDPFNLSRFVAAQDAAGTYARALDELRTGRKASHWMWFVFPQIARLGHSSTSRAYAISSLEEAHAYLRHPVLGPRLRECAGILTALARPSAEEIFGATDALKLRSSMTLFAHAAPGDPLFARVLRDYFDGARDPSTEHLLLLAGRPGGTSQLG
jgi:uncharacterized protein (DUF1810 family)